MNRFPLRFYTFLILLCSAGLSRANQVMDIDSITPVKIIPLYFQNDEYTSRYCGAGLARAICELNNVYKDHGVLFSLTPRKETKHYYPVDSLFIFDIEKTTCSVRYNIEKAESVIFNTESEEIAAEVLPPSPLQLQVTKPSENSVVHYTGVDFSWNSADEADQYLLEVANDVYYTDTWISSIIFGTGCFISDLPKNTTLYWRIKPLNFIHYCEEQRASGKFYVSEIHLKPFTLKGVSMYSMPPPNEKAVFINNPDNIGYEVRIESISGELITRAASNAPYKKIDVGDYEPGGYFVYLTIDSFSNSSTLIVK